MLSLIDELEHLLRNGIHVPASGKVVVDENAMRQVLEQMREAVPDEVRMAQRIAAERDRILNDARTQARRMIEEAQTQAEARVEEQAIVQAARQRAREIQAEAEQRAAGLRADANSYVMSQLGALESRLQRLLREVQAGQRSLAQSTAEARAATAAAREPERQVSESGGRS